MPRELLEGPILFRPILGDARRGVQFEGTLSIGEILPETWRQRGWRPRCDLNARPSA